MMRGEDTPVPPLPIHNNCDPLPPRTDSTSLPTAPGEGRVAQLVMCDDDDDGGGGGGGDDDDDDDGGGGGDDDDENE